MKKDNKNNTKDKEDDTMSAAATNFVYEIKVDPKKEKKEPLISKELLDLCKKNENKYPLKK